MPSLRKLTEDFHRGVLIEALNRFEWNKSMTGRQLGLSRKTVERMIIKLGIEEPEAPIEEVKPKRRYNRRRL